MFCDEPKLRTEIKLNSKDYPKFNEKSIWCGVGSCFSENLLLLLEQCGFEVSQNPSGIIYNSYSMYQIIARVVNEKYYSENDFFEHDGSWHSWGHHGRFSNPDLKKAVQTANIALKDFRDRLKIADAVVLTPSSSVVYCLKDSGDIVANCHKVDNKRFEQRILSSGENRKFLTEAMEKIQEFNAKCKIIFTLSPVRHYPGNLILNARSKANLLSALHEVCDEFPENCIYFPSYEILHDELRDYRFYKTDLLHPSEQAVQLICGRFIKIFFEDNAVNIIKQELAKAKLRNHRTQK
jgi:GSCFA family